MSSPQPDYFDANLPGVSQANLQCASQTVRIVSFDDAKVFVRRWVIRDKDPALKALLRHMEKVNGPATTSAIGQFKQSLAARGLLVMTGPQSKA
jgi:hypothetical protein